jgi:hypothetical protein
MARVLAATQTNPELAALPPKTIKQGLMPFAKQKSDSAVTAGSDAALEPRLPFDEAALFDENLSYLCRALNLEKVVIKRMPYDEQAASEDPKVAGAAPGAPGVVLVQ